MKKKRLLWLVPLVVLLAVVIWASVFYFILRGRSLESRPLVLIQSPLNGEYVDVGKGKIVHASARSDKGIKRMELWVDGQLEAVTAHDVPALNGILSASWTPQLTGRHTLIVRAITRDDVIGQATVFVVSADGISGEVLTHVVEIDETLETIAAAYEVVPEEIVGANEQLGGRQPQVGETLDIPASDGGYSAPFDSWADEPESPLAEGEVAEPPASGGAPPGSMEALDLIWPDDVLAEVTEPIHLVVEVVTLQTREAYEALHCYVSLAGSTPLWMPDADNDQTTDESFGTRTDGTEWNVAQFMADTNAHTINWESRTPVPLDISCVGIREGGTDSVDLGRVLDDVHPDQWGIRQAKRSSGGESQFNLAYQVNWRDKGLDTSITPPWNLRLEEDRHLLLWEYLPDEDGRSVVDGFAILLNGALQWVENGSARESRLPEQWFNLPCGDAYDFQVVAFVYAYPDGNYSLPSNTASIHGGEIGGDGCGRTVVVTFEQLLTGDLPGNPDPVYGSFIFNDSSLDFDGRPIEGDNFPSTFGLRDNQTYYISQLMHGFGGGENQLVVELPPGNPSVAEIMGVVFEIYKGGSKVCSGELPIEETELTGTYRGVIDTSLPTGSVPDWCRVNFTITPVSGSPVIESGAPPPLPDLRIEQLSVDASSGRLRVHVRNVGTATWESRDLIVRVFSPVDTFYGDFTWPDVTLQPGEMRIISHGGMDPQPPQGACVLLDPGNLVYEESDRLIEAGILRGRPAVCRPQPDLFIEGVSYNRELGQLNITLQNWGEVTVSSADTDGSIEHADLIFWINPPEGRPLTKVFEDFNMEARETRELSWPLSELERERLTNGYTITANPTASIPETDTSNNSHEVKGTTLLKIAWRQAGAFFCSTGPQWWGNFDNHWYFSFNANLYTGSVPEVIANWHYTDLEIDFDDSMGAWCTTDYMTDWFEVGGDEELVVTMSATMKMGGKRDRISPGGIQRLTVDDNYGGVTIIPRDMDAGLYSHYVYTNGISHAISCGSVVGRETPAGSDPFDWNAGMHRWGPSNVPDTYGQGGTDRDPCYWSSTFMLYQAEEP